MGTQISCQQKIKLTKTDQVLELLLPMNKIKCRYVCSIKNFAYLEKQDIVHKDIRTKIATEFHYNKTKRERC